MHRNTFILLIFLGVLAAMVAGVNLSGRNKTSEPSQRIERLLEHTTCGISYSYPEAFTKVDIETGGTTLINNTKTDESIVMTCQKEIPRVALTADKIDTMLIGTVSATIYHDRSAKENKPIDKLIFTHPTTNLDVYVAGYGSVYNQILETINLVQ